MSEKISTPAELINPPSQAYVNKMIGDAVKEAIAGVFQSLTPVLKDLALTPEKLRDAQKPYVDPAAIAREKRERAEAQERDNERVQNEKRRKESCPHLDANGKDSISLIHNRPDRQPMGICVNCHDLITPMQWMIAANEEMAAKFAAENGTKAQGRAYLQKPHKDFARVLRLESFA